MTLRRWDGMWAIGRLRLAGPGLGKVLAEDGDGGATVMSVRAVDGALHVSVHVLAWPDHPRGARPTLETTAQARWEERTGLWTSHTVGYPFPTQDPHQALTALDKEASRMSRNGSPGAKAVSGDEDAREVLREPGRTLLLLEVMEG